MKYLLPPAWSLRYQQFGRFGILLLLVLVATRIGRPIFEAWMTPVTVLASFAIGVIRPYMLMSPFGLGL
jgi:hypothetical protein